MMPLFSVVTPVYNRAATLGAALRSVLAQSEQDFEIVVIDDGSRDSPENIIESFHDRRIVLARQDNRGGSAARNAGIDRARGRYVAFLDSDDVFLPHHLATMRRLLDGTRDTAGYAPVVVDRGRGRSFVKPPRALAAGEHMATYLLCDRGFVPTTTLVVPREWAARVRYDEALPFAQDTDFAIRLFLAGCRFAMAPQPTGVWNDITDPKRVSAGRKNGRLLGWLDVMRPRIPERSYYGGRGWMVAKGFSQRHGLAALRFYLVAVLRGCYRPRLAAVVLIQIFTSDRFYRRLADWIIAWRRGHIWSRGDCVAQSAPR
ncbi:MAG TPA: glycosyltransferase [Rhizomicrobium sp.]|jgi:glycosyltransferase involved in cell wall biosynthesis|nr:glycosyltransferase [Rhizomicrobium sp.]